jgi:hypothetical protein
VGSQAGRRKGIEAALISLCGLAHTPHLVVDQLIKTQADFPTELPYSSNFGLDISQGRLHGFFRSRQFNAHDAAI